MRYVSKKKKQIVVRYWVLSSVIAIAAFFTPWFLSIIFGVLIFTVPVSLFALCALKTSGAQKSRFVLTNFFLGEMVKWVVTIIMFIGIYKHYAVYLNIEAVLMTYVVMHLINPLILLTI